MKHFFLIFAVISFLNISMAQTNYYVDSHLGTDTTTNGTGSDSLAWKTIEYAVNHVTNPSSDSIIIHISTGTYNLASNQIEFNRNFLNLMLIGEGIDTTIVEADSNSAVASSRVFKIDTGNNVTLKRMTIENGHVSDGGGGILNNGGELFVDYCKVTKNLSERTGSGGGICSLGGSIVISNSTISYNTGVDTSYGGGFCLLNGNGTIMNSTICFNSSVGGGGIAIIAQGEITNLNITNSTIYGNTATYNCGAIRIDRFPVLGDSLSSYYVLATINSCTIFNNVSTGSPGIGGIGVQYTSQPESHLYIKNTIVAGNTSTISTDYRNDIYGHIISEDYNLIQNSDTSTISGLTTHNIYGKSPYCMPLALNNSKNGTMTCAIPDSSPAVNKIPVDSSNGAPLLDQRGATRNGNFDIGAYEFWDNNGALPVELSSFIAALDGNNVDLKWTTATEINNRGFQIEKNSGSGFIPLAFISGHGTSTKLNKYTYTDKNLSGGVNSYRLKQIDYDGSYKYSKVVEVNLSGPNKFTLSQNYPNPFNPTTTIRFSLPNAERVRVIVFNQLGQEVAQITDRDFEAGNHAIQFDGSKLASGVYFYRIQAGTFSLVKKMILLK